jgi:hypothetical protein
MLISAFLFRKGHPLKAEASLSTLLDAYKRKTLEKIRSVSGLDQMTDGFVERLVKDSLVEPLTFQFDRITKKVRAESFDGSQLPLEQFGDGDTLGRWSAC